MPADPHFYFAHPAHVDKCMSVYVVRYTVPHCPFDPLESDVLE